jgi:hypothetical protein
VSLQVRHEPFAHRAAQIEEILRPRDRNRRAQHHRAVADVGHHQRGDPPVPQRALLAEPHDLFAYRRDRHRRIDGQHHRPDQRAAHLRPVLERRFEEAPDRHHHAAIVPQPHDDVREVYLLDDARLELDRDDVAEADRLRERDLHASDDAPERLLRGEAEHHAGDAGRREQRDADRAHDLELDEQHSAADQAHHERRDAPRDEQLRPVAAGLELARGVVGQARGEHVGAGVDETNQRPRHHHDQRRRRHAIDHELGRHRKGQRLDDQLGHDDGDHPAHRPARRVRRGVVPGGLRRARDAVEHPSDRAPEEAAQRDADQHRDHEANPLPRRHLEDARLLKRVGHAIADGAEAERRP